VAVIFDRGQGDCGHRFLAAVKIYEAGDIQIGKNVAVQSDEWSSRTVPRF